MRIAAGILMIIGGFIGDIFWIGILKELHIVYGTSLLLMLPGVIAVWGGICTLQRKHWGWALSGAICSLLFPFFGIPAIILLVKRKGEFSQSKEGFSYDQVVFLLLKRTSEVVKDTSQTLINQLDATEHSKLPKVEEELFYFFVFALDYWWQTDSAHTQEEKRIWKKIFSAHLDILFGDDPDGREMWDTLQERFIAYGQIVNEKKGDTAKYTGFGMKLSEFCDMPNALFLVLAPDLFTKALESVSKFKSVQLPSS